MPLINHNGTPRQISWTRVEHMSQVLGCSTDYFIQTFASEADVQKAITSGVLKKGDKVTVNGVTGTIQ